MHNDCNSFTVCDAGLGIGGLTSLEKCCQSFALILNSDIGLRLF